MIDTRARNLALISALSVMQVRGTGFVRDTRLRRRLENVAFGRFYFRHQKFSFRRIIERKIGADPDFSSIFTFRGQKCTGANTHSGPCSPPIAWVCTVPKLGVCFPTRRYYPRFLGVLFFVGYL